MERNSEVSCLFPVSTGMENVFIDSQDFGWFGIFGGLYITQEYGKREYTLLTD